MKKIITTAYALVLTLSLTPLSIQQAVAANVLTATAKGDSVTLKWNLAKTPQSQKILIQSTDGKKSGTTVTLSNKIRVTTISGLSFNSDYKFTLLSKSPSQKISVSVETGPEAPLIIEHRRDGSNLLLSWEPVLGATSYDIQLKAGNFSTKASSLRAEVILPSIPADKVQEVTITSKGPNSLGASAKISIPSLAPGVITGLEVVENAITKKATFTWLAPGTNITSYRVSISSTPGGDDTFEIPGGKTSYELGEFFYGTKYIIKVSAINKWGTGPSGTLKFNPTQNPSAPLDLKITIANNGFDLVWSLPADSGDSAISSYIVEYSTGSTWLRSPQTSTGLSNRLDGLPLGKNIRVRVIAVNSFGESEPSKIATGKIPAPVIEEPVLPPTLPQTPNPVSTPNPGNTPSPGNTPNPGNTPSPGNTASPTPSPTPTTGVKVFPGSLCSPSGLTGVLLGKTYTCKSSSSDTALRWRE